ncbi:hypothetical protein JCM12296A_40610 [Desulfosarcina cetonica]|uniref:hypothetical protein n=1 Tax=Desulfosarcina cetonica TaxID=90730 RepID=UPI0012ECEE64|nr:hypothetical protein [Desulfosarcina cetonica]
MKTTIENSSSRKPMVCFRDGRFWFTREAERRFYFILTLLMLGFGILYKAGVL